MTTLRNFIIAALIIFIAKIDIYSQDTNIVKFFPLKAGNVWFYDGNAVVGGLGCFSERYYHKISIDSSKTFNGKVYFKFSVQKKIISGQGNCGYNFIENGAYYRVDSISGNIYKYIYNYTECQLTLYERLVDSLKGRIGDTTYICFGGTYHPDKKFSDTSSYSFLTFSLLSKEFYGPATGIDYFRYNVYSKNFGLVKYGDTGPGIYSRSNLKGCIIGGIVYGDTTFSVIGINQISSEIPDKYLLGQNYPNPFNPITNIKFDIPKSSYINLTIYDVNGKEISVLVNEDLQAGGYSVDWEASAYPSGVYFYRITAVDYVQTKKMVLLK